jgi:large subunit ribosomal protein L2
MPLGTAIHNIEITLGKGGQLARAAGAVAELIAKEDRSATLRLPSGEVRLISENCSATIGQVGNITANNRSFGKAGAKRWLGKRSEVRGVAMNPVDHPHGGGEGRTPIGRKKPVTPWGYSALGKKSRKSSKLFPQRCRISSTKKLFHTTRYSRTSRYTGSFPDSLTRT